MREILFRAKRVDNGEEVIGSLIYGNKRDQNDSIKTIECVYICWAFYDNIKYYAEVIPETVRQFTGLCDKNGKRIFEGNILRYNAITRLVSWNVSECGFCVIDKQGFGSSIWSFNEFARAAKVGCEIIGNMHDNPELLEVVE